MIYKIVYDIDGSVKKLIDFVSTLGDFIFSNDTIYLNTKHNKNDILFKSKKILNNNDQILISEILKKVTQIEDNDVSSWCKKIWFSEDKIKLEKDTQKKMIELNNAINQAIENLEKQLREREVAESCKKQ